MQVQVVAVDDGVHLFGTAFQLFRANEQLPSVTRGVSESR
jgi:hypothetical protein